MRAQLIALSAVVVVVVLGAGCGVEVRTYERDTFAIHHINVGVGNVWAIDHGDGLVLVDLAEKGDTDEIVAGVEKLGYTLGDVKLAVVTHGHMDHAGPVAALQDKGLSPVALGAADVAIVESGVSIPGESLIWEGDALRGVLDPEFPPWTPDIVIQDDVLDLAPFGVPGGRVIPMPGHTAGTVAIVLESGDAFVGDMIRGGGSEDHEHQGEAVTHFFSDDQKADRDNLDTLLGFGVDTFFPGHGPYFDKTSLRGWLADRARELGELE